MEYAPRPTEPQLGALAEALGRPVELEHRLEGGLGCTMDVIRLGTERAVLRRYGPWYGPDDDPGSRERLALDRLAAAGLPAPRAIWADRAGVFAEHAIVISFVAGAPLLTPDDPSDWAGQLAESLAAIHELDPTGFPPPFAEIGTERRPIPDRFLEHPLGERLWESLHDTPTRDVPVTFIHQDFHPGNVLFADGRLAAVVDWEDAAAADPMLDVAYCEMDLRYTMDDAVADRFLEVYFSIGSVDDRNLHRWRLAALARPLPALPEWVGSWNLAGVDITVETAQARHQELVARHLAHP